jgi:CRP-like cAMP-binding protein
MESSDIRKALEGCEFFKSLHPNQIATIIPICRFRRYAAGESVYRQGDSGEELFIIADGQVILERAVSVGARKGNVAVAILGKGRVIGCWSTLLDESHTLMLSAVCKKPSTLVALRGADLRGLMTSDIRLGFNILEQLCFLLRERVQLALGAMENI